jgi:3-isopropylmalate dehydrogenase
MIPNTEGMRPAIDILLVRESVGGAYFSPDRGSETVVGVDVAWDTIRYTSHEVARVARRAFEFARHRSARLTSVDKANVLESSKLWRRVVTEIASEFRDVEVNHMYVDNCATQLVMHPSDFDVIVTENLFGDILSDEIAGIVGSLGLLPSATIRDDGFGLYEPVHGSAPQLANLDCANPAAAILSGALLLRYSAHLPVEARWIEESVSAVFGAGIRTPEMNAGTSGVGTIEFTDLVIDQMRASPPKVGWA